MRRSKQIAGLGYRDRPVSSHTDGKRLSQVSGITGTSTTDEDKDRVLGFGEHVPSFFFIKTTTKNSSIVATTSSRKSNCSTQTSQNADAADTYADIPVDTQESILHKDTCSTVVAVTETDQNNSSSCPTTELPPFSGKAVREGGNRLALEERLSAESQTLSGEKRTSTKETAPAKKSKQNRSRKLSKPGQPATHNALTSTTMEGQKRKRTRPPKIQRNTGKKEQHSKF